MMKKEIGRWIRLCVVVVLLWPSILTATISAQAQARTPQAILETMSTREKIIQTIMPDFRNWGEGDDETGVTELNEDILQILHDYPFGGVILFAENVVDTEQTARLVYQYQKTMLDNNRLPLLLTIDQEGGIVNRLGTGTALPGNMALGATNDVANAKIAGQIIGRELSALGVNVNFAPVVDVNNNPGNPVIGLRSFSSNPELVGEMGAQYIAGLQEYQIATAAKHFPGHGDTATDSHIGISQVDKSYEELKAVELAPFQRAIDAGVDMLMTAHIQYPQVDPTTYPSKKDGSDVLVPATLSSKILTDIVRGDMGYDGIIVTDAMNMGAISENFGEVEAAVLTKKAGADIILMPTIIRSKDDVKKLEDIVAGLEQAVEDGSLPIENLNQSVLRILTLKEKIGLLDEAFLADADIEAMVANAHEQVGSAENRQHERELAQKAITLVKNEGPILPLDTNAEGKTLVLAFEETQVPGVTFGIERMIREERLPETYAYEVLHYTEDSQFEDFKEAINQADRVVVLTSLASQDSLSADDYRYALPQEIFSYAKQSDKQTIQISVNKPYDVAAFNDVDAILIAYGFKGMDPTEAGKEPTKAFGPNIPAAIEAMFAQEAPSGVLPVSVPKIENHQFTDEMLYELGFHETSWRQ
ncbi:glycoside hydrolase family 3 N-terminal domain-containing protein [Tuanshanicoccus lijuaniae]|uniref:glycoside hydrolase family 3 N-terminal domain-containing protein n=1 Tax=Aerococcaceae bacterium zg-1292 TaxID=2774330 RepID=UPI001BD8EDFA|nr:glycoside hydrolase family 3 C-terminal domain-containing protein [Aerococcaceae bacterium zg-A91]MBS4457480.1 glycoside hydrolase family 3 C-terminal domain-containing protein [Aerococcaceae bacterium zg-BR33]